MNTELKAILDFIFDCEGLVEKLVDQESVLALMPQVFSILSQDFPAIMSHWADIKVELESLAGSEQEQDLIAYVETKLKGRVANPKVLDIVAASLHLVGDLAQDILALQKAFQS